MSRLEPEFASAYQAWKGAPGPHTADGVLKAVGPVLDTAVRTYAPGADSPTIRAHAKRIALASLPGYDPGRAKLRTHLLVRLQTLRRHAAGAAGAVRVPERVRLDRLHLARAHAELTDRLGRDPSTAELAGHARVSPARIRKANLAGLGEHPEGAFSHPGAGDGGPDLPGRPVGAAAGPDADPWVRFVYQDLAPEDQLVLEHSLGLFGRPRLPKVAIARKLKVSPAAVTQRAERISRLLAAGRAAPGGLFS